MNNILNIIKKIIPKEILDFIRPIYHKVLSHAAAFYYRYPSEKMIVIGVTGTNGKSTTAELIARVLEYTNQRECEHESTRKNKVGLASTVKFKIGDKEWLNDKKMTMLGRFALQKLLHDMVKAGCKYAVIETSSEGIKQFRHKGINYDYLVFTNLTPEHIESHGSFEKYKEAKLSLFKHLEISKRKKFFKQELRIKNQELRMGNLSESMAGMRAYDASKIPPLAGEGALIPKMIIVNGDDKYAQEFLNFDVDEKVVYGVKKPRLTSLLGKLPATSDGTGVADSSKGEGVKAFANDVKMDKSGTYFKVDGEEFKLNMLGKFNVYNAFPAIIIGQYEGMNLEEIKDALEKVKGVPGRMEFIDEGQKFSVLVDYAPEPESMRKLYEALGEIGWKAEKHNQSLAMESRDCHVDPLQNFSAEDLLAMTNRHKIIIHVLGSCGGGRDKARRKVLGEMATENADIVIVTNEDPYDDDPMEIINEVASGAEEIKKLRNSPSEMKQAISRGKEIKKLVDEKMAHREPHPRPLLKGEGAGKKVFKILDRREAIRKALELAKAGDLVLVTGKGSEQAMCVAGGKKIPWDDREVVRLGLRIKK